MIRSERFIFSMAPQEREVLQKMASQKFVKQSELVRELIRNAAGQAGLWPPQNGKGAANGKAN